jgi:hypothetical protein
MKRLTIFEKIHESELLGKLTLPDRVLFRGHLKLRDPRTLRIFDFLYLHTELRRPGVTLELLHHEYLERHPDGTAGPKTAALIEAIFPIDRTRSRATAPALASCGSNVATVASGWRRHVRERSAPGRAPTATSTRF